MDCPRCKLVNPPTAKRCDCGYDFETRTVEKSYDQASLPKEIRNGLLAAAIWNCVLAVVALASGDALRILVVAVWSAVVWVLYSRLVKGSNSARVSLAVLTFPLGTAFFTSTEARLYCMQARDTA